MNSNIRSIAYYISRKCSEIKVLLPFRFLNPSSIDRKIAEKLSLIMKKLEEINI